MTSLRSSVCIMRMLIKVVNCLTNDHLLPKDLTDSTRQIEKYEVLLDIVPIVLRTRLRYAKTPTHPMKIITDLPRREDQSQTSRLSMTHRD